MMLSLLRLLGVDTQGYNRAMLHFAGARHSYSLWLSLGLIALFIISGYFTVKPLASLRRKVIILVLHFFALVTALLIFMEPELRLAHAQSIKSQVAVLLDSSESMSVSSGAAKTRVQAGQDWLKQNQPFFNSLANEYEVRWFRFDEKLSPLAPGFMDQGDLKPDGPDTRIMESVSAVRKETGGKPLAGVILLSDGADRAELSRIALLKPEEKTKALRELEKNLSGLGKIYPVLVGTESSVKDLAIAAVGHDSYGFVKNPFVVSVKLRALGDIPSQTSVSLFQEDKLLVTRPVTLEPGKEQKVELEFIPQETGRFLFKVEVPVYEGEASVENNSNFFPLTIIRDRIRVLYIVGNPSWDEKFLRQTLRKNPAVDLISFYILREYFDNPAAPEQELALIPFPTNELFTKELNSFDLVIFQDFFGAPYMYPDYILNLRNYVADKGGALIYIGGPRSFIKDNFNYALEDILPVDFSFTVPNYKPAKFKMRLTDAGTRHPITRLINDEIENKKLWDSLAEFDGYNQLLRPKPDAQVLLESKGNETPAMVAVRSAGKGRTMSIATDSLWRWHFLVSGTGQTSKYYQLFWERALRWLMRDPEMKPLSLAAVKEYYHPAEEVSLFFQVQDNAYEPVSGATVNLEAVKAPENCAFKGQAGNEIAPGKYRFSFKLDCPGGYRFQASAKKNGNSLGTDQEILVVKRESAEMDDLRLHPEILSLLADAGAGKLLNTNQSAEKIKLPKLKLEELTSARDLPVWDNWLCWLVLVFFFSLTWALRRFYGLS